MKASERLKKRREQLGLTQQQLADAVQVSYQAVQQWEGGKTWPKRVGVRAKLAAALKWTEHELEFGSDLPTSLASSISPDNLQVLKAFEALPEATQTYYREQIFRDAAIATVLPWLRVGRPTNGDYDAFERRVESDFQQLLARLGKAK